MPKEEPIDTYCEGYGGGCPDKVSGARCEHCKMRKEDKDGNNHVD